MQPCPIALFAKKKKPYSIAWLEDDFSPALVGVFGILLGPPLNVESSRLMNLLDKLCFLGAI